MRLRRRYLFALLVMGLSALLPTQVSAAEGDPVTLVADRLDTPRGVSMLSDLAIIAEAGHAANTGQVSSVNTRTGAHHTIVGGLFSFLAPEGDILGVSGVSVANGQIYAIFAANPRETGNPHAGQLVKVNQGSVSEIAQVGGFNDDWTATPAAGKTQEHDSNPNAVLVTHNGFLVADSGSNTITSVSKNGKKLAIVHFFPNIYAGKFPHDEVPTCIASTDDALWVGTLAGHLWKLGEDGVTQVVPKDSSGKPLLSRVTGCTTGANNTLYLVNMFGPGEFGPDGPPMSFFRGTVVQYNTESGRGSELANSFSSPALQWPYTPAVGRDGNLYVTAGTICQSDGKANGVPPGTPGCVGGGRLVKIHLASEDNQEGGDNQN